MINCNYFITTPDPWVKLHTEVGKKFAEESLDLVCYHFYIEYWTLSVALKRPTAIMPSNYRIYLGCRRNSISFSVIRYNCKFNAQREGEIIPSPTKT